MGVDVPDVRQRQTNVTSHRAPIGSYQLAVSPAVAIFVDVSYQSDLLGLSAGEAETSKFLLIPTVSALNYTMGFAHSVGEDITICICHVCYMLALAGCVTRSERLSYQC